MNHLVKYMYKWKKKQALWHSKFSKLSVKYSARSLFIFIWTYQKFTHFLYSVQQNETKIKCSKYNTNSLPSKCLSIHQVSFLIPHSLLEILFRNHFSIGNLWPLPWLNDPKFNPNLNLNLNMIYTYIINSFLSSHS